MTIRLRRWPAASLCVNGCRGQDNSGCLLGVVWNLGAMVGCWSLRYFFVAGVGLVVGSEGR